VRLDKRPALSDVLALAGDNDTALDAQIAALVHSGKWQQSSLLELRRLAEHNDTDEIKRAEAHLLGSIRQHSQRLSTLMHARAASRQSRNAALSTSVQQQHQREESVTRQQSDAGLSTTSSRLTSSPS
jgi:hypothetical protein